ncbi:MAG: cation:proton antiporter [Thermoanaerobaculia bacterium]
MTRSTITLLLVAGITYAARSFIPAGEAGTSSGTTLAFGFLLVAAIQAGHVFHGLKLPHLTGFILCGLVFGPEITGLVSHTMVADLTLIKGVAIGYIALLAGCELNLRKQKMRLRNILSYWFFGLTAAAVLLFIAFFFMTGWLPLTSSMTLLERAAVSLVCANVLCAFSSPVVIGIINEAKASGPFSEIAISVAVLADLTVVVTFSLSSFLARAVFPQQNAPGGLRVLILHIFGSMVVGFVVGTVLSLYMRLIGTRTGLFIFAVLFVVAEAGRVLYLNPLLVGLSAGFFLENFSSVRGHEVAEQSRPAILPTYAIFFTVIGAELHVRAFLAVAPFALLAATTRAAGIFTGSWLGTKFARLEHDVSRYMPYGMFPQAGIAIALATLVLNEFGEWGAVVGTVLFGSIVVNEMIGPILFRGAIGRAGEAGRTESPEPAGEARHEARGLRLEARD